jgi:hypothetical protein
MNGRGGGGGGVAGMSDSGGAAAAKLLAQNQRSKANELASHDAFVARYCAGPSASRLRLLGAGESLEPVLQHVHAVSLLNKAPGKVLVALDFDQTITCPGGGLRGSGDKTARALRGLSQLDNIEVVIVTATKPSQENALAIASEVRSLGLGKCFDVTQEYVTKVQSSFTENKPLTDLGPQELTQTLAALLVVSTDRTGRDLWRIDVSSVQVDLVGGTASFRMRTLPPDTTNEDRVPWDELGPLSSPQLLVAADGTNNADDSNINSPSVSSVCPVRVLHAYLKQTKYLRGGGGGGGAAASDPSLLEPLLLDLSPFGDTWEPRPLPPQRCAELLGAVSVAAGLEAWEASALLEGEARVVRGKGPAQVASSKELFFLNIKVLVFHEPLTFPLIRWQWERCSSCRVWSNRLFTLQQVGRDSELCRPFVS